MKKENNTTTKLEKWVQSEYSNNPVLQNFWLNQIKYHPLNGGNKNEN